jgi:hypothetical protein
MNDAESGAVWAARFGGIRHGLDHLAVGPAGRPERHVLHGGIRRRVGDRQHPAATQGCIAAEVILMLGLPASPIAATACYVFGRPAI